MNEAYNADRTMTLGMAEDLVLMAVNSVKEWTMTNVDKTDLVANIKAKLDLCNREVVGTTAAEKCQLLLTSINAITTALRNAGAVIADDTPFSQFAQLVSMIGTHSYKICLMGKSGTRYSAVEWQQYIDEHGTTPEPAQPAVITPYQSFVIGLPLVAGTGYSSRTWANTTDSVPGLYGAQTGSFLNVLMNSLIFESYENTRRILLYYNPEKLPHTNYDPSDPDKDYSEYGCVRFATKAEMEASGIHLMYDQQVYVVTNDETDNTTNQAYYWNGVTYIRRFVVPRVANNITGAPAAEFAWDYKAYDGDERQYTLPTINHLLMMYVYYPEINTLLSLLHRSTLPTGTTWTCQQSSASGAWCVTIPSAGVNGNNKNNTYAVVPVAAL